MKDADIKYIVVHCSATKPVQDIGLKELDVMHKQRGFESCGYHFIIRQNGVIEIGRPLAVQGAHVGGVGHNHDSWGVCLVGGLDAKGSPMATFGQPQMQSAASIIHGLILRAPTAQVLGHRDLSPDKDGDGVVESQEWLKQCPCFDTRHWWKQQ